MRNKDNSIRHAFYYIKADRKLKNATLDFLQAARHTHTRPRWIPALGVLCALLTLTLGIGSYTLFFVPVSYVSVDVNPSIELSLNRLDHVICAEAYNAEGASILDSISLRGKYFTEALDLLVESEAMKTYLDADAALTFTIASDNAGREQDLLAAVESTHACSQHGGTGFITDIRILEEAHKNGLSLGKYAAFQILSQYDESITASDCHSMSMSEIHNRIEEHESSHHDNGHGSGHHSKTGSSYDHH